jgi:hypothetical protein
MDQMQIVKNAVELRIGQLVLQNAQLEAQVAFLQQELAKAKLPPLPDDPPAEQPKGNGHAAESETQPS